jgi:hypothetical protein
MNCATALMITDDPQDDETEEMVERSILEFLSGESDGAELFQALYGAALDEPIPPAMLALVRGARSGT